VVKSRFRKSDCGFQMAEGISSRECEQGQIGAGSDIKIASRNTKPVVGVERV